jgi:alkylated DNA repair dioxygenase AlkB
MLFETKYESKEVYVAPDSLYIMSGEARYIWKHSMLSRKTDMVDGKRIKRGRRISLTFRNVPN